MKPVKIYRHETFELVYENGNTLMVIAKHPEPQGTGDSVFAVRGTVATAKMLPDGRPVKQHRTVEIQIPAASAAEACDRAQLEFEAAITSKRIVLPEGQLPPDLNLRAGG